MGVAKRGRPRSIDSLPDLATVEEAASVLRISRCTAYEAVRRGEIPCLRYGRAIRIPTLWLRRMIEEPGNPVMITTPRGNEVTTG